MCISCAIWNVYFGPDPKLWVESDGLGDVSTSSFRVTLAPIHHCTYIVGLGVFRLKHDGLGGIGNGSVKPLFAIIPVSPCEIGHTRFRVQLDGFGAVGDSTII